MVSLALGSLVGEQILMGAPVQRAFFVSNIDTFE